MSHVVLDNKQYYNLSVNFIIKVVFANYSDKGNYDAKIYRHHVCLRNNIKVKYKTYDTSVITQ